MAEAVFRRADYRVAPISLAEARIAVEAYHYAKGSSNTAVYTHGLIRVSDNAVVGALIWLPPTRVAAESVDKKNWEKVLGLSRMVIFPGVPKNAGSFLISKSVDLIRKDGRFKTLLTYADESQGHTGQVYRASNWEYLGRTPAYPRWLDRDGKQISVKATKSRTKSEMEQLGYVMQGKFCKHKFILRCARG